MAWNGSGDNNILTIMQGVNELTGYWTGVFMLVLVFGIVYFMLRGEPTREGLVGALFATMIVAIIGRVIGLVQDIHLGVVVVLFLGSLAMLINRS